MSLAGIRTARSKSLKKNYSWATTPEYRMIKKIERADSLTRSIDRIMEICWRRYGVSLCNAPKAYEQDATIAGFCMTEREKLWKSISRIEKKYGLDRDQVLLKHFRNRNIYGSSF